jgi:hypothetical protein
MEEKKFLLISQSRSGSTKTFSYLCEKLGIHRGIKEVQQEPEKEFITGKWMECNALGLLTDPVFYQSRRKALLIDRVIRHCAENKYTIIGLFRQNKLKRYISEKYAYHKKDFSMTNKNNIVPWVLEKRDIEKKLHQYEEQEKFVKEFVNKHAKFDYILTFEEIFEKEDDVRIEIDGRFLTINIFRESYLEIQRKLYSSIINLKDMPSSLLEKYPLI